MVTRDRKFEDWMRAADRYLSDRIRISIDDLPDRPFRDMYEAGTTPEDAAREALAYELDDDEDAADDMLDS